MALHWATGMDMWLNQACDELMMVALIHDCWSGLSNQAPLGESRGLTENHRKSICRNKLGQSFDFEMRDLP